MASALDLRLRWLGKIKGSRKCTLTSDPETWQMLYFNRPRGSQILHYYGSREADFSSVRSSDVIYEQQEADEGVVGSAADDALDKNAVTFLRSFTKNSDNDFGKNSGSPPDANNWEINLRRFGLQAALTCRIKNPIPDALLERHSASIPHHRLHRYTLLFPMLEDILRSMINIWTDLYLADRHCKMNGDCLGDGIKSKILPEIATIKVKMGGLDQYVLLDPKEYESIFCKSLDGDLPESLVYDDLHEALSHDFEVYEFEDAIAICRKLFGAPFGKRTEFWQTAYDASEVERVVERAKKHGPEFWDPIEKTFSQMHTNSDTYLNIIDTLLAVLFGLTEDFERYRAEEDGGESVTPQPDVQPEPEPEPEPEVPRQPAVTTVTPQPGVTTVLPKGPQENDLAEEEGSESPPVPLAAVKHGSTPAVPAVPPNGPRGNDSGGWPEVVPLQRIFSTTRSSMGEEKSAATEGLSQRHVHGLDI